MLFTIWYLCVYVCVDAVLRCGVDSVWLGLHHVHESRGGPSASFRAEQQHDDAAATTATPSAAAAAAAAAQPGQPLIQAEAYSSVSITSYELGMTKIFTAFDSGE